MSRVIVEREFDKPVVTADLEGARAATGWCFDLNGIRHIRSYLSHDGRRMICEYEAPDVETVRRVLRQYGVFPFQRIWSAIVTESPTPD
jgi:hypothetical protein